MYFSENLRKSDPFFYKNDPYYLFLYFFYILSDFFIISMINNIENKINK